MGQLDPFAYGVQLWSIEKETTWGQACERKITVPLSLLLSNLQKFNIYFRFIIEPI